MGDGETDTTRHDTTVRAFTLLDQLIVLKTVFNYRAEVPGDL